MDKRKEYSLIYRSCSRLSRESRQEEVKGSGMTIGMHRRGLEKESTGMKSYMKTADMSGILTSRELKSEIESKLKNTISSFSLLKNQPSSLKKMVNYFDPTNRQGSGKPSRDDHKNIQSELYKRYSFALQIDISLALAINPLNSKNNVLV